MLDTSARLLRLLTSLQSRRHWPGNELAERLEVTPRTLRRDVDRLRSLGYTIDASSGPGGGYQLGTGSVLPPLLLDDDEAVALAAALRSATDAFTDVSDSTLALLVKLEQLLPRRLRGRVGALQAMTVSVGHGPRVDAELLITLASACRENLELDFDYSARDGAASHRHVQPLRLAHTANRRWYLVAWDVQRADWRTFRVDRIRAPVPGQRFVPQTPPPDVERYVAESISAAPYQYRARLLLKASADEAVQHVPSWLRAIEPIDSEHCALTIGADSLDAVIAQIVLTDLEFELLEPAELGPRLLSVAKRLAAAARPRAMIRRRARRPSRRATQGGGMARKLDKRFTAILQKSSAKGGWTYLIMPGSADFFGTRGLVKVRGTIDGEPFESAFMALGDGRHKLPVKADVRRAIAKQTGDRVTVVLKERLN